MAEKQLTTIEQLRALAERGKQDTLIRINELLDFQYLNQIQVAEIIAMIVAARESHPLSLYRPFRI